LISNLIFLVGAVAIRLDFHSVLGIGQVQFESVQLSMSVMKNETSFREVVIIEHGHGAKVGLTAIECFERRGAQ
jgi:hypothetical protein